MKEVIYWYIFSVKSSILFSELFVKNRITYFWLERAFNQHTVQFLVSIFNFCQNILNAIFAHKAKSVPLAHGLVSF